MAESWVRVSEQLPAPGEEVWLYCKRYGQVSGYYMRRDDGPYWIFSKEGWQPTQKEVTHWMPLQPKPE